MPKVTVHIATYNRPKLLKKAIQSVLDQTFQDFEIIVVDDGLKERAEKTVQSFEDERIRYIQHAENKGLSAARNTGIRAAKGEWIAFLDDDDTWVPEKLEIQMNALEKAPDDVGFCFSALTMLIDGEAVDTTVPDGVADYYVLSLRRFNGFLSGTLVIKRDVFKYSGLFDELLPSHTDIDLIIRIAKKYRGLGINKPLLRMKLDTSHEHMGSSLKRRIAGRTMLFKKYEDEFRKYPKGYALKMFQLGLFYRDDRQYEQAKKTFRQVFSIHFKFRYFLHYVSMLSNGFFFRLRRLLKDIPEILRESLLVARFGAYLRERIRLFGYFFILTFFRRYGRNYTLEKTFTFRFQGKVFPVFFPTFVELRTFRLIFIYGEYSTNFTFNPHIIIDAGSHIGLSAIYFVLLYPSAQVYAIEANPDMVDILKRNTRQFPQIKVFNYALSESDGVEKFYIQPSRWQASSLAWQKKHEGGYTANVGTKTLDSFCQENSIKYIDILKLDIEGAEEGVIKSVMARKKTRVIIGEIHYDLIDISHEEIVGLLSSFDVLVDMTSNSRGNIKAYNI